MIRTYTVTVHTDSARTVFGRMGIMSMINRQLREDPSVTVLSRQRVSSQFEIQCTPQYATVLRLRYSNITIQEQ